MKGRGLMDATFESVQERELQILQKDADLRTQPSKHLMQSILKIILDLLIPSRRWRLGTCVIRVSRSDNSRISFALDLMSVRALRLITLIFMSLIISFMACL